MGSTRVYFCFFRSRHCPAFLFRDWLLILTILFLTRSDWPSSNASFLAILR